MRKTRGNVRSVIGTSKSRRRNYASRSVNPYVVAPFYWRTRCDRCSEPEFSRCSSPRQRPLKNATPTRSEEHTSELQSLRHLVCRLLLEKKKTRKKTRSATTAHAALAPSRTPSSVTRSTRSC